jgi:hypothetical protein
MLDGGRPTYFGGHWARRFRERTLHLLMKCCTLWREHFTFETIFMPFTPLLSESSTFGSPHMPHMGDIHALRRMTWHLRRVYLIWGASLGSFDSFTHVSWIFYVFFTISLGFVKR